MMHYLDYRISIEEWTRSWKCSNQIKKEAINLYEAIVLFEKNGITNWLVYQLHESNVKSFVHIVRLLNLSNQIEVKELMSYYERLSIRSRSEIEWNGHELQSLFPNYKKGPWIKKYIRKLEKAIVMNELENDKKRIKEWILCHPPEVN